MIRRYDRNISYGEGRSSPIITSVRVVLLIIGIAIVPLVMVGCTTAIGSAADLSGHIKADGSTALQPLVQKAATLFEKQHPQVKVDVQGGGSKTGLGDVTTNKSNIGDSDLYADPAIYPDPNLTDHIVCVIPFTMIVNPDVNISSLTQDEIVKIFSTGEINNWDQIGGPDLAIKPVVRPPTSGTRDTFRKYILGGRDENGQLLQQDSSTLVRDTVAHTPGAISYLALSVLNPSVRAIAIDGYTATQDNIASGHYTFWAYEHMYTLGDDNPVISAFLEFMLGSQVQQLAKNLSYIPIANMKLPTVDVSAGQSTMSYSLRLFAQGSEVN